MDEATLALTAMTGLILITFLGFMVWAIRTGQFKNIESAKYQLFRDTRKPDISRRGSENDPETQGGERS